jgi:flavorubredoxin
MNARKINEHVLAIGAIDWDRRLFDCLIPLPDGTSYNAYLIKGSDKTVLVDSVDPAMHETLMDQLKGVPKIDFIVCHHAEQDHSGTIPEVLAKYPAAQVLCTPKCRDFIMDHLLIPADRIRTVDDNEKITIGNRTLQFMHTPWVHWPETMLTYLVEDKILFTCDFLGSHIAASELFVEDEARVYEAAKRYYAEIMMPFRPMVRKHVERVNSLNVDYIAPSHGQVYNKPSFILNAYQDWISDKPKNLAVIPYISMHGSTRRMVEHLTAALAEKGVSVQQFDLSVTDIGKLAISLVDAATVIIGTPTVHVGPHPTVVYAACLANALRPKVKFASIIGSYGWATKAVEQIAGLIPNLKAEVLTPLVCKGFPKKADLEALDKLAESIAAKHKELGIL